jgi:hypothetical protein
MDRLEALRADFELLGRALESAEGSAVAAIARERRLMGELLEKLEASEGVSLVDELARKRAEAGVSRPSSRRGQSGRSA